jgi:hypothetical protein
MEKKNKATLFLILIISILYFSAFYFPNSIGSENPQMVAVFEPDEAAQLTPTLNMIAKSENFKQSLIEFFFYDYYFYGFPFFALSAILLLPLRFLGELANFPLVMTILRQLASVLPMIIAIGILVYLQTKFKSLYKTILLFLFLFAVPAVVRNNLWWHPDSLSFLFVALTFFFLERDDFKFSRDFYLAALFCGFATGTKWTGVFFFLTIPTYIIWALIEKKISLRISVVSAIGFIGVMLGGILISNPILIYANVRTAYYDKFLWQGEAISTGYEILYARGVDQIINVIQQHYGYLIFYIIVLVGLLWGIIKNRSRLLNILLLSWVIPYLIYLTFFVAVKFQYLLPVMIPFISGVNNLFKIIEEFWNKKKDSLLKMIAAVLIVLVFLGQFGSFISRDIEVYTDKLNRVETSESLQFYEKFKAQVIPNLPTDRQYNIYKDVRLYLPDSDLWYSFAKFETLDYAYFDQYKPDIILLIQQRINDYTQPDALKNAIDPVQMQLSYQFYTDANNEQLVGYTLVFRDEFGLAYIKNDLYETNFTDVKQ